MAATSVRALDIRERELKGQRGLHGLEPGFRDGLQRLEERHHAGLAGFVRRFGHVVDCGRGWKNIASGAPDGVAERRGAPCRRRQTRGNIRGGGCLLAGCLGRRLLSTHDFGAMRGEERHSERGTKLPAVGEIRRRVVRQAGLQRDVRHARRLREIDRRVGGGRSPGRRRQVDAPWGGGDIWRDAVQAVDVQIARWREWRAGRQADEAIELVFEGRPLGCGRGGQVRHACERELRLHLIELRGVARLESRAGGVARARRHGGEVLSDDDATVGGQEPVERVADVAPEVRRLAGEIRLHHLTRGLADGDPMSALAAELHRLSEDERARRSVARVLVEKARVRPFLCDLDIRAGQAQIERAGEMGGVRRQRARGCVRQRERQRRGR